MLILNYLLLKHTLTIRFYQTSHSLIYDILFDVTDLSLFIKINLYSAYNPTFSNLSLSNLSSI